MSTRKHVQNARNVDNAQINLKIAMITSQWTQTTGGPSSHVSALSAQLKKMGHQIWILSAEMGEGAIYFGNKPFLRGFNIFRSLMTIKPNIIHMHGRMHYIIPALFYKIIFGKQCRLVFSFHTQPYIQKYIHVSAKGKRDYAGVVRLIAKWLIHKCDEVISCSHSLISNLNKYYNMSIGRYTVLYTGTELPPIDAEKLASLKANFELSNCYPILTSIGVFSWDWKVAGHQICIEAVSLLKNKYPNIKLLIVGRGKYEDYLVDLVREKNLGNHVTFLGYTDSMRELLDITDIYVHMALHEAMGLSLVEAMHAMKPVIVANRGGLPELVENNVTGLVIEPNAEVLFSSVDWLVEHGDDRIIMAQNAFKFAGRFLTLEYFSNQNQRLYKGEDLIDR